MGDMALGIVDGAVGTETDRLASEGFLRSKWLANCLRINFYLIEIIGDPSRIRTCNPRSRNPLLYPVELWDHPGDPIAEPS
jgi:hypothetical protein